MKSQRTIEKEFTLTGIEPAGGNPVQVTFSPLPPDSGIIFSNSKTRIRMGKNLQTKSSFGIAQSMILKEGKSGFMNLEHDLGTLFVYDIDNLEVHLDKEHSLTSGLFQCFGQARRIEMCPYLPFLERSLCDKLEEAGIREQAAPKKCLRLKENFESGGVLKFEKIDGDKVRIRAMTEYYLRNGEVVKGDREISLVPEEYKPIASARAFFGPALKPPAGYSKNSRRTGLLYGISFLLNKEFIKFIGNFIYLSYGLGRGADETNLFFPPRSEAEWRYKENIRDEVAAHTIIDRAGDIMAVLKAYFNATPAGMKVTSRFAGHRNAIRAVRENLDKFYVSGD